MLAQSWPLNVCRLSAYWLGASPETFYRLYTGAAVVLFLLRWLIYQTKGCGRSRLCMCH